MFRPRFRWFASAVATLLLMPATWAQKEKAELKAVGPDNPSAQGWYASRSTAETRKKLALAGGANEESEAAIAAGLAWLSRQQKKDGSWAFDDRGSKDTAAATGMGLLPFLGAGYNHNQQKGNPFRDTVRGGINVLLKIQKADGSFSVNTYAHAIATLALCEALGMTGDKQLVKPVQSAINLIQKGQGKNGSWGYKYGDEGDTSILGWQVQALQAAKMCKDLKVDQKVLDKAVKFLEYVSSKGKGIPTKCLFGYSSPGARTSLTAVGLLCNYSLNDWGPDSDGLKQGGAYLLTTQPPEKGKEFDAYYHYYATQVMHLRGGDDWETKWNPSMRALLVGLQIRDKKKPAVDGSWDKDAKYIGDSCGAVGTTVFALLTLEVYYRHLPLEELANKKPEKK